MDEAKPGVCQDFYTQINSVNAGIIYMRFLESEITLVSHYLCWVFLLCAFRPFSICEFFKVPDRKKTKRNASALSFIPTLPLAHLGQNKWPFPSIVLQLRLLKCPGWSGTFKSLCEWCCKLPNATPSMLMASQYIMSFWDVIGLKYTLRLSNLPLKCFMYFLLSIFSFLQISFLEVGIHLCNYGLSRMKQAWHIFTSHHDRDQR